MIFRNIVKDRKAALKISDKVLGYLTVLSLLVGSLSILSYPKLSKGAFVVASIIILFFIVFRPFLLGKEISITGKVTDSWLLRSTLMTEIEVIFYYNEIEYKLNKKVDAYGAPKIGEHVPVIHYPEHPTESFINIPQDSP